MRLLVDLLSHLSDPDPAPSIIQVQRVPEIGSSGATPVNGKYVIPMPLDVGFPIDINSYILDGDGNIDGGDVISQGYAHLLAAYPQFSHVYFNPLLTSDHVAELVTDSSFHFTDRSGDPPYPEFTPRFQTGREEGVADDGQMPTHTALLPANTTVTPNRPGFLITQSINIGPYTLDCEDNPVGADEFMLFWRLYQFNITHDVAASAGALSGTNTPALRYIEECDPEPNGFSAYISTDEGANWCRVGLLEPVAFCDKAKTIRIAFRNDSNAKIFLATFALMF